MHYKSPYPPLPPIPEKNVHDFIFSSPALTDPADKLLLIDPLVGKGWRKNEFKERVFDCATALVTSVAEGGLGFAPEGEMVGIMSTNCLVSLLWLRTIPCRHTACHKSCEKRCLNGGSKAQARA